VLDERTRLNATPVPFVDLTHVHRPLKREILDAVNTLLERNEFVNGAAVTAFEEAFAGYCGARFCAGVASGLDAVRLSLQAGGIDAGDEVIVPANTFVATLEAVTQAGGVPVLVDATLDDYNIDPRAVEAAVGPRTRFLLPVHLYGQLADMASLAAPATRHELAIVEDACQAHGAKRGGYRPGDGALAAAFSFYPAKNLGAIGDAGAIVTNDTPLVDTVRKLREHGQRTKYEHELIGWTARLDAVQAAVLSVKLPHLERWNAERRAVARTYGERLAGTGDLVLPSVPPGSEPVWHLYVVRTARPDELAGFLRRREIATGRHYPVPVHLSPAYAALGYGEGAFPVAEQLARELLSLPIFPGMTEAQISAVVEAIEDYFAGA
jgi:dTDP-4-amino-4,6-dideoxygalactose transaminase